MRQPDLFASPTPARTDDDPDVERDLFGNPIPRRGDAARAECARVIADAAAQGE